MRMMATIRVLKSLYLVILIQMMEEEYFLLFGTLRGNDKQVARSTVGLP